MWLTGLVAPQHVGSSQTRARTRVPCIGRQIFNHCATREDPSLIHFELIFVHGVGRGPNSFFRIWLSIWGTDILSPLNGLGTLVENQLAIDVWVYF